MAGVTLEFAQFGHFDSFDIIRSLTSMASTPDSALPSPIVTGLKTMYYVDTSVVEGLTYYFKVRVHRGLESFVSDEIAVDAIPGITVSFMNFEGIRFDELNEWLSFGGASITNSQSRFGAKSLDLAGTATGKYIATTNIDSFNFKADDFSIEHSVKLLSNNNFHTFLSKRTDNGLNESFCYFYFGGSIYFDYTTNGSTVKQFVTPFLVATGVWYDMQLIRSGAELKLAVNGTQLSTFNIGGDSIYTSTTRVVVGQLNAVLAGGYLNGYIDELRVTKGYARKIATKTEPFVFTG